jgi:hypothetical protein
MATINSGMEKRLGVGADHFNICNAKVDSTLDREYQAFVQGAIKQHHPASPAKIRRLSLSGWASTISSRSDIALLPGQREFHVFIKVELP